MRRTLGQIHLWLGLTIGLLWAIQGLTGAMLVFHREVDRLTSPATTRGSMASIDTIIASAAAAAQGAPIIRLAVTDGHRDLINAFYPAAGDDHDSQHQHRLRVVVVDAATARPVGTRENEPTTPFSGSPMRWIDMLHMALLGGRGGEILIGVSGLILLTAALTGLCVAWPPRRGWKAVFSYHRWRTPEHRLYGWHRAIGFTAGIVFLAVALAGAPMSFEDEVRSFLVRVTAHQPVYRPAPVKALRTVVSPQRALDIAQARFPQANWARIFMPTARAPVYTVRLHQPGESRVWLGRTTVVVDPVSGGILYVYDALTAPLSNRILDAAFPLHNGELAGLPGRVLVVLAGLALPTLYVTGMMRWFRQRKRKRASARAANAANVRSCGPVLAKQTAQRCSNTPLGS